MKNVNSKARATSFVSYPLLYAVANMCASDLGDHARDRGTYFFMFAMAYNVSAYAPLRTSVAV